MSEANLTLGLVLIGTALLIVALALPLLFGRIPMNAFYGVRFAASFTSSEAWYRINQYGARQLILWSLPLFVLGPAAMLLPLDAHPVIAGLVGLSPGPLLVTAAFRSYLYARRTTLP